MKKRKILSIALISLLILTLVLVILFKITEKHPSLVEKLYGNKVYDLIIKSQRFIVGLVPFSLFELSIVILIVFIVYLLIRAIINTRKRIKNKEEKRFQDLIDFSLVVGIIACFALSMFMINGGFRYNGESLASKHGLEIKESSTSELEELCIYLSKMAAHARNKNRTDLDGSIINNYTIFELSKKAQDGYKAIEEDYPNLKGSYPQAKPVLFSHLMSYTNITGIYPYIIPEALVNYKTPLVNLPATICHEMAHQRGYAREDEANFMAYLACINNTNPLFEYSGYYMALNYSLNALKTHDEDKANKILKNLDPGILHDKKLVIVFWQQYETPNDIVASISEKVNNQFLENVNVEDGTHSYGRMVDLLLAERRKEIGD